MKDFYFDYDNDYGFETLTVDTYKHKNMKTNDVDKLIAKAFNVSIYDELVDAIKEYFFRELHYICKIEDGIVCYSINMMNITFHFTIIDNI